MGQGFHGAEVYFCEVQSPAIVKPGMGLSCDGRYLLRPGMAA